MRRGSFFVSAKLAPGVHDGDNGLLARNLRAGRKGAVDGGDERTSESVARLIREYQQSEGVRLKDVLPAYRVN